MTKNCNTLDTIQDFGEQWREFTENTGFYGSLEALHSLMEPLMTVTDINGQRVADVGAGTGRYTRLLHEAGAAQVLALEPSEAYGVLKRNTVDLKRVRHMSGKVDAIPEKAFDLVFCIGVLMFIPDAAAALRCMGRALRPNGRLFLWVYGSENNGWYLSLIKPLRALTTRVPHAVLKWFTHLLLPLAEFYALLSKRFQLPLAEYLENYFLRVDRYSRRIIIYDQLNPRYAKYYSRQELRTLLEANGFHDIRMHHRMGYSWSVVCRYQEMGLPQKG